MNVKKLVQVPVSITVLSFVAFLPACGGSVDATTCGSVRIGDTRNDVDGKLGTAASVSKGTNGAFAVGRYESTTDGKTQCCIVTFDSEAETALTTVQPAYQATCTASK